MEWKEGEWQRSETEQRGKKEGEWQRRKGEWKHQKEYEEV